MGKSLILSILCLLAGDFSVTIVPGNSRENSREFTVTVVNSRARKAELPVMELIGAPWCAPCRVADAALLSAKSLPFKVVHIDSGKTSYDKDIPAFRWKTASGKTYVLTGWYGIDHLLSEFKRYK